MASAHLAKEETQSAVNCAAEAKQLCRKVEDRKGEANVLQLLADASLRNLSNAIANQEAAGTGDAKEARRRGRSTQEINKKAQKAAKESVMAAKKKERADLLGKMEAARCLGNSLFTHCQVLMVNGKSDEALVAGEESLLAFREAKDQSQEALALALIAEVYVADKKPEKGIRYVEKALTLTRDVGDPFGEANALRVMESIFGGPEDEGVEETIEVYDDDEEDDDGGGDFFQPEAAADDVEWSGLDSKMVLSKVQQVARDATGLDEGLGDDSPLMEAGMDSLSSVDFRNRLAREFGMQLPAALIFDHPSITALVSHIVDESKANPPPEIAAKKAAALADKGGKPGGGGGGGKKKGGGGKKTITRVKGGMTAAQKEKKAADIMAASKRGEEFKVKRPVIVGSWDNWAHNEMIWDKEERVYSFTVKTGKNAWESFQILSDGDYKKRLYPDQKDACPHAPHQLFGPDDFGHGFNWTVGKHANDDGAEGAIYEIKLSLNGDNTPRELDWSRQGVEEPDAPEEGPDQPLAAADRPYIVGTWNNWGNGTEMVWDSEGKCYTFKLRLGENGWESFQILLNNEWKRCIHPDKKDGCPHGIYNTVGPDDEGTKKNWTVGKHPLDRGAEGIAYRIRLVVKDNGSPELVDWVRTGAAAADESVPAVADGEE
eukprot:gnl/TRDRNA2_/TRDRNA2_177273_c2_seq5.p1 gnl/TRDRNA2_/TRDRNA2_177273_c2~~gnl/TRDRNA2_/TRDRNA2_177273_c2_seq5.p1  ORF type:complete len:715 (-),score=218.59 gnl/TRDRNA2_/TRDRNA2_177273_c2_seq5:146-2125(-)